MPRWTTSRSPVSSFSSRYLPLRSTPVILAPSSRAMNCFFVPPADRARAAHLDGLDPLADDLALEVAPDGLDLGQLRHGRADPSSRRSLDASSFVRDRAAAACSACFFDRPSPSPWTMHPDVDTRGEEALRVVGALVVDLVARAAPSTRRAQAPAAGSCSPGRRARRRRRDAVAEQAQHESRRRSPAAVEVHGADHGFERVGEDRRLLAPAGCRPRPCRAAARAEAELDRDARPDASALTTDARTLASSPSGRSGYAW